MTVDKTLLQPFKDPHRRELLNDHDRCSMASSLLNSHSCRPVPHALWQPAELGTRVLSPLVNMLLEEKSLSSSAIDSPREMTVAQVFLPSHGNTKTGWKFWGCVIHWGQKSNDIIPSLLPT